MIHSKYRALIVDDEPLIRGITVRAMQRDGFVCDEAEDGEQALASLASATYDVIITDLRMPRRHGHSLVCELLECDDRPLIIVLTGVREARLAKDLYSRGVEQVEFKPVDYDLFPTKVKSLLNRRQPVASESQLESTAPDTQSNPEIAGVAPEGSRPCTAVPLADVESKLPLVSSILPFSQAPLDVFMMTGAEPYDAKQIVEDVRREPALVASVLQLANNRFHNSREAQITDLGEAIVQLGQRRVGEVALASTALSVLAACELPWMNVELAIRRSIAAGMAIEWLIDEGGHTQIQRGLFASAVVHSLGRVVLGTLYRPRYEAMIEVCRAESRSLLELERQVFPESHTEVAARLLSMWNVPADICHPLKYILDDYQFLARLSEPTRTKVELIKLAVFLGQIAVNRWESWDYIEIPSDQLLRRLNVSAIASHVGQVRSDLVAAKGSLGSSSELANQSGVRTSTRQLMYHSALSESRDLLEPMIASMGIKTTKYSSSSDTPAGTVLVHVGSATIQQLAKRLQTCRHAKLFIATDTTDEAGIRELGTTLALPCSYAKLRSCCWRASAELNERNREASDRRPMALNVEA